MTKFELPRQKGLFEKYFRKNYLDQKTRVSNKGMDFDKKGALVKTEQGIALENDNGTYLLKEDDTVEIYD